MSSSTTSTVSARVGVMTSERLGAVAFPDVGTVNADVGIAWVAVPEYQVG